MQAPETRQSVTYQEAHCALRWPLLALGLFGPAAVMAACVVLAATVSPVWLLGLLFVPIFLPFLMFISLLYRNWPSGIRIDESAISIGAVGSAAAARRTPTVNHQGWGLFSCPWSAVLDARVVTDPAEVQRLRRSPEYYTLSNRWLIPARMKRCKVGVLSAPFMRAALVVEIEDGPATIPRIRPARFFGNGMNGRVSRRMAPVTGSTWVAPTRDPGRLSRALAGRGPGRSG
jgi:hypothetical protein